jgi:hypothetical protein
LSFTPEPVQLPSRTIHSLKCWPPYFDAIGDGRKTFEVRKLDRDFRVGDMLHLHEVTPPRMKPTSRHLLCFITCKMDGPQFGIRKGWTVLGLRLPANHIWPIKTP